MKFKYQVAAVLFVLLALNSCQKEHENPETELLSGNRLAIAEAILMECNDTTAFKNSVDLQPLEYLLNCYSYSAVKEVPGLGANPWIGNCEVFTADTILEFRFKTYKSFFGEFLTREEIGISSVPISIGSHTVFDNYQWQQNQSLSFGSYARFQDDGDVLDGFWAADTLCNNYIEITRLNLEDMEVEGRFELHFKMKTQGTNGVLYSERINFIDGKFKAEIED